MYLVGRIRIIAVSPKDKMHVAGHNAPGINLHAFVLPAVVQAFRQDSKVLLPRKHVNPVYHRKADKV